MKRYLVVMSMTIMLLTGCAEAINSGDSITANGNATTGTNEPDTTPPTLSAIASSSVAGTTADIKATSNEAGTMYYVITTSATAPSNTQILAGQNETSSAALKSGNSAVILNTSKTFSLTGLSEVTQYYYYIVSVDESSNKSVVGSGSFITVDTIAPTLTIVGSNSVLGTTANISATSNEAGTMYYVITASATAPTNTQVVAGQNDTSSTALKLGNSVVTSAASKTFSLTGLSGSTKYYYYIVVKDASGNLSSVATGNFTTIPIAPTNYVARYKFENGITDSQGSYNLSVKAGGLTYTSTAGKFKEGAYSAYFNESSSLKTTYTNSGNAMTISAWVYLDESQLQGMPTAVDFGGYGILYNSDTGKYSVSISTIGTDLLDSNLGTKNTWVHIVFTYDETIGKIYINGVLNNSLNFSDNITLSNTDLTIGDYTGGNSQWKGYIDDVQIFNRAITDLEATAIFSSY